MLASLSTTLILVNIILGFIIVFLISLTNSWLTIKFDVAFASEWSSSPCALNLIKYSPAEIVDKFVISLFEASKIETLTSPKSEVTALKSNESWQLILYEDS